LSHTSSPFCSNYFGTEILKAIFPVSASQVARITATGSVVDKISFQNLIPEYIKPYFWRCKD
jgi:hypothetical protein